MEKISVSELSIGDWVCAVSGTRETPPMRVVGLGESWINLEIDPEQGDAFEYTPDEIRGIPITAEMLEKNGWTQNANRLNYKIKIKDQFYKIDKGVGHWHINIYDTTFEYPLIVAKMYVVYIHELQRFMRLVGVTADLTL